MDIPLQEPILERPVKKAAIELPEAIVEIVSDSGEGAQKCGQSLGAISAKTSGTRTSRGGNRSARSGSG